MSAVTAMDAADARLRPTALETARLWTLHLLSLTLPLLSFSFLVTGPHAWYIALLWVLPLLLIEVADQRSHGELRQPLPGLARWPFDSLLFLLVGLHFVNLLLLGRLFAQQSLLSVDAFMTLVMVGANSGFSGIVVAHELIHRPRRHLQLLGRAILCTVMYEHFYTEHVRGHHVRVGTPEDPATARFGERFWAFYRRTLPAQFRSAWRLETTRLGDPAMRLWDPRILRSRVLHGLAAEWALAFAMLAIFGAAAFVMFLLQAWRATMLLEYVNYIEHWGLTRSGQKVRPIDSWDTDSWFTLYALVGLSRHAEHHAFASRPYQQLRCWEESPKLPRGYIALLPLVLLKNQKFIEIMSEELRRRKLGPFAAEA
ncbi:MAG: alkane 1-monooxygenase [Deltaproteobacteria bacterium]|nr:alkane 1-monooxygenase [Deltaproteobacteria bacterium]